MGTIVKLMSMRLNLKGPSKLPSSVNETRISPAVKNWFIDDWFDVSILHKSNSL